MEKRINMIEEYYLASNTTLCMKVRKGRKEKYSPQENIVSECYPSLATYWHERLKKCNKATQ